jgi:excisionase family DNA binding protein
MTAYAGTCHDEHPHLAAGVTVVATTPVTIEQAAAILGLSTSTVRRRIRDGRLRAEEVSRPQGIMRLVYLPDDADPGVTQVSAPDGVVTTTAVTSPGDSMIAYTQTLLLPLVEALERSQATVGEQAEAIGRLEAENRALVARTEAHVAEPAAEPSRPPRRVWWLWLVLLAPILVTAIVGAGLLMVPR